MKCDASVEKCFIFNIVFISVRFGVEEFANFAFIFGKITKVSHNSALGESRRITVNISADFKKKYGHTSVCVLEGSY